MALHHVPECLGSSEDKELEVNKNNSEIIAISQQQKVFIEESIQNLESSRLLCTGTLLFAG